MGHKIVQQRLLDTSGHTIFSTLIIYLCGAARMNTSQINQTCDFYEESRSYPRIKTRLPITLSLESNETITASIYDISPDGLQIRCNRHVAAKLNPGGKRININDNVTIKAGFLLPVDDEQRKINVTCKIYYFVIIPGGLEEDVAFGLMFKNFEGKSIKYIGQHIQNELEPVM
jgi:hypothetical protein